MARVFLSINMHPRLLRYDTGACTQKTSVYPTSDSDLKFKPHAVDLDDVARVLHVDMHTPSFEHAKRRGFL